MAPRLAKRVSMGIALALVTNPAPGAEMARDTINSAAPAEKPLPSDQVTPVNVRVQVLLDRAHFSPGEIDGKFGENASKALGAYAESQHLQSSNVVTGEVWKRLSRDDRPVLKNYTITQEDISGPFLQKLPSRIEDMKDMPKLGFTSPREALAEKFHISEHLLAALNPGQRFDRLGDIITVVDTSDERATNSQKAKRIEVDKSHQTVKLFDRADALIGFYPATVGSEERPSPTGTFKVTGVSRNPTYRYNPDYRFKGIRSQKPFTVSPGPNNPVGTVWIGLSAEGYGIHGTPLPGKVSKAESHGCVRLTNWDAERVADRVRKGTPVAFIGGSR